MGNKPTTNAPKTGEGTAPVETVKPTEAVKSGIKAALQPVVDLIDASVGKVLNKELRDEIVAAVIAVKSTRAKSSTPRALNHIRDTDDKVVAIFCGYFETWFALVGPKAQGFGTKSLAHSSTGYNSMSTKGMHIWTSNNKAFLDSKNELIDGLMKGTLFAQDTKDAAGKTVVGTAKLIDELTVKYKTKQKSTEGFDTIEDVKKYLVENKISLS